MERAAELVERFAKVASRSIALQVCVIFPCMVLLCKIFGLFAVWTAGIATTVYYLIRLHNEETQKFHKSYVWTLQSLIHKRHELPEHTTADEATRDAGGAGETLVLESMANMWWKTNGQSFFQKSVLDKIVDALNENIANNNSMVQEFIAGKVQLSTDSPKLLAVHCKTSSYNSIYQDMNWEYHSNTSLPFSVVIASRNIPIEICKIKFLGTIRVETIFPHQEYKKGVQCKEQESYTMAISIIDEYLLDFDIVASSINLGGIPSLRKWIRNTIYKKLRNKALWPNQIRLFGPADHLFRQQDNPTIANSDSIQLDYAEPIPIELQPESKEPPKFITGISLFFPDGKSSSPPAGFDLIDKTCTGNYAANLASGSVDQRNVYLCVKSSSEGAPLNSIAVVKGSDLESMPEEFRLIRVTDFGEDAYISQVKGKQGSRVYFCYEKGPTEKGYITDIRVMFDSEIPKVRELKQRYDAQGVDEFPIGYTTLHVNTVRQANGDTKRIFLCIKRTGGTTLKNLAPESTSAPSLRTTGSNIINKLHTLTNIAVNEAKDIKRVHSEKRLKRLESIGITSAVIEKVKYLSKHPEIIQNYPLEGRMPKDDFFVMNESQQNHAIQIMKQVPQLGEIRRQLAPAYMSDSAFWYAYFSFMKKTIEDSV